MRLEVFEDYCWATTCVGLVIVRPIRLQRVGIWISSGLSGVYVYS